MIEIKKGKVLLYLNGETKSLGTIKDGKLVVKRDREKHYFNYYHGYAFCKELIDFVPEELEVEIKQTKSNIWYTTPVEVIKKKGIVKKFEGYEEQYVLATCNMVEHFKSLY